MDLFFSGTHPSYQGFPSMGLHIGRFSVVHVTVSVQTSENGARLSRAWAIGVRVMCNFPGYELEGPVYIYSSYLASCSIWG